MSILSPVAKEAFVAERVEVETVPVQAESVRDWVVLDEMVKAPSPPSPNCAETAAKSNL